MRHIGLLIGIVAETLWHRIRRGFQPATEPFFWLDGDARVAALERDAGADGWPRS